MWFKKQKQVSLTDGLAPALGVLGYIALFTGFITLVSKVMPGSDPWWAPFLFLTLFCLSVLICGLVVFYQPYMLFVDKRGKEAMQLVLSTTKWLGILAFVVILVVLASV